MQSIQFDKTYLDDGLVYLEVSGPVNPATTGQFNWIIWGLFAQKSYRILLDLSKISTIDSTGIGVLVNATETAQENGGDLVIVNPSEKVRWCVKTLNLGSLFSFADTREEAEKRFAGGKPGSPGA